MHGPSVTTIECRETSSNALKSNAANNMKEEEPGMKWRKVRRGSRGVEAGADYPFKMGSRRPRTRAIGETAAPTLPPIPDANP